MIVSLLLSCSKSNNELEEIEARIAQLESQGKDLKNQGDQLAKEGDQLQSDIENAQDQINQLTDQLDATKLLSFEFLSSDNPLQVVEDTRAEILDDNSVEIRVLNIMSSKTLIPRSQHSYHQ